MNYNFTNDNNFLKSEVYQNIDNFKRVVVEHIKQGNFDKEVLTNFSLKYNLGLNDRQIEYLLRYLQKNNGNISSFMITNLFNNLFLKKLC